MSLSQVSIEVVKESAPLIAENSEKIVSRMYENLFASFPGMDKLFEGVDANQHKKFASAISTYAEHIDNLPALSDMMEKIASTHVCKKVKAEHYPMMVMATLGAMDEVLGEAATEELLTAWKDAYLYLAHILITREKELYAQVSK